MSMLQIQKFLNADLPPKLEDIPKHLQPPFQFYFIYDTHYSHTEFNQLFPNAVCKGVGKITGWQWHINDNGLANIRKAVDPSFRTSKVVHGGLAYHSSLKMASDNCLIPFIEGVKSQKLLTPAQPDLVETFGYIFKLPVEDDAKIQQHMVSQEYFPITQPASVLQVPRGVDGMPLSEEKRFLGSYNVIVFLDLRNTRDGGKNIFANAVEEVLWNNGLKEMEAAGAPKSFLDKVRRKLKGDRVEIEPTYVKHDFDLNFNNRLHYEMMQDARYEHEQRTENIMQEQRTANIMQKQRTANIMQEQRKNQAAKEGLAMQNRHRVAQAKPSQDSALKTPLKRPARNSQIVDLTAEEKNESPPDNLRRSLRNKNKQASTSQTPPKTVPQNNQEKKSSGKKTKEKKGVPAVVVNRRLAAVKAKARAPKGQRKKKASNKRGHEAVQSAVKPPPPKKVKITVPKPKKNLSRFKGRQGSSAANNYQPKVKSSLRNVMSIDD